MVASYTYETVCFAFIVCSWADCEYCILTPHASASHGSRVGGAHPDLDCDGLGRQRPTAPVQLACDSQNFRHSANVTYIPICHWESGDRMA
eukprot:641585-Pleurochrysis_carterae.AAC.1